QNTVKVTFYKWLSPEGNWIHEKGVKPTVEQKQPAYFYTSPIQVEKTFVLDQNDEEIAHAQTMLKGIGYESKREYGYFDETTKRGVQSIQKDHDLKVTDEKDEKTAGKIESEILDIIRSGKEYLQLEKALDVLYK